MRVFILAGGLGTRLKPRFGELPKPLAPVGGRPFLARQLEWLAAAGVRDAVLCTGYGADAVRAALGDGAANIGSFHEACNLAGLWHLPLVCFIENNAYSVAYDLEVATAGAAVVQFESTQTIHIRVWAEFSYQVNK